MRGFGAFCRRAKAPSFTRPGSRPCSPLFAFDSLPCALLTEVFFSWSDGVRIFSQPDDDSATRTESWIVSRRVLQLNEVVLVGPVPDVNLSRESFTALAACLPIALVLFSMMMRTQGVATVITVTAVSRIGEGDGLVLIIAYPPAAALRQSELFGLAANTTLSLAINRLLCSHA